MVHMLPQPQGVVAVVVWHLEVVHVFSNFFFYTMYVLVTVKVSVYMLYVNVCFSLTCLPLAWAGQSRSTTPQARQELVSETRSVSAGSAHLHTESAASVWPGRTD